MKTVKLENLCVIYFTYQGRKCYFVSSGYTVIYFLNFSKSNTGLFVLKQLTLNVLI